MNATISRTADEWIDRGEWERVCEIKGINPWAVNEGLMDSDEVITVSIAALYGSGDGEAEEGD